MAHILDAAAPTAIRRAAALVQAGGLVAFPTETVYGLGADALNERAVAQVFAIKQRPEFDPLIVHIADSSAVPHYASRIDDRARALMKRFWPGPLTLVLPKRSVIPDLVTAGLGTVGLRMPAHPVALSLLREAGTPIAAPSANPFGYVSPTTARHVQDTLGQALELILDGGPCTVGLESTVCALTDKEAVVLRPGGVSVEDIEAVIGPVCLPSSGGPDARSPGTLPQHYAPRVPITLLALGQAIPQPSAQERVGLFTFVPRPPAPAYTCQAALSAEGNLVEAAANLFAALHRFDRLNLDRLVVETVPEQGIGRAIMDRLRRASALGSD